MKQYFALLLIGTMLIPLNPHPTAAHNGAVAIAVPVEGIVVDGDLSDWPEGMREYEIATVIGGPEPENEEDFQGWFRIGYNGQENALYVAVEVQDGFSVVENPQFWERDGCEIFIDLQHKRNASPVLMVALWGNERGKFINLERENWGNIDVSVSRQNEINRYEWRINWESIDERYSLLHSKALFGFDVVVNDSDGEGSHTQYITNRFTTMPQFKEGWRLAASR